jgi:hypothetical protein
MMGQPLTTEMLRAFYEQGFYHFPGMVDKTLVDAAVRSINCSIGKVGLSLEDLGAMRVNSRSFGDEQFLSSSPINGLLHDSPIMGLVKSLLGPSNVYLPSYSAQVALRFPQEGNDLTPLPWHIDNVTEDGVKGFTLLVGVFLNATPLENSGNFTVFPGGHRVLEQHFKSSQGCNSLQRAPSGRIIVPDVQLSDAYQIRASPGDVVFAHHQLPHRAAPNTSPNIRVAVFFRIYHPFLPFEHPGRCELRNFVQTNIWSMGWSGIANAIDSNRASKESDSHDVVDVPCRVVASLCSCGGSKGKFDIL